MQITSPPFFLFAVQRLQPTISSLFILFIFFIVTSLPVCVLSTHSQQQNVRFALYCVNNLQITKDCLITSEML